MVTIIFVIVESFNLALQYFDKYTNLIKCRQGENSKEVAVNQLNYIIGIIDDLMKKPCNSIYYRFVVCNLCE